MELTAIGLLLLAAATAAGAFVQAATGFGFAILAAPIFLAVIGSTTAVPILVALHIVQSAMLVPRIWPDVPGGAFRALLAGAALGCPLGLVLFRALDIGHLKVAAGAVILLAAALLAVRRRRSPDLQTPPPRDTGTANARAAGIVTGLLSGALTAVLVMPGPPLMVQLMQQPLPPTAARALSLAFFAACYVAVLVLYLATGALDRGAWWTVLVLAAPVALGTLAGRGFAARLADRHFIAALNVLLVLAGLGAIASAL